MLHELPVECLRQIIGYLPSATAVVNVALTNRTLCAKLSADNWGVFQYFLQESFPSIKTCAPWQDSAIALTSRSRAWDRRAVIAREVYPPEFEAINQSDDRRQKMGYVPVIDSYETLSSSFAGESKEVIAWAAGGKVNVRSATPKSVEWRTLRFENDHQPFNDILDLRLLRPHQCHTAEGERILLRRGLEVATIKTEPSTNGYEHTASFLVENEGSFCMEISPARDPLLALCDFQSIRIYPVRDSEYDIEPADAFSLDNEEDVTGRQRCARFLSDNILALAPQHLHGKQSAPVRLYDINATRETNAALTGTASFLPSDVSSKSRRGANVLAPLDKICGNAGQLFLSGWSDGITRLHDTRTGNGSEMSYTDRVDDGQILSLLPIGHESFLAGSHQNGCLKTFDMRMPGARAYSYLDARAPISRSNTFQPRGQPNHYQRGINILLALKMPYRQAGWKPLPVHDSRTNRYRGSVYSLSGPSPSSPAVYAGIEDHVIQLDFAATEDVKRGIAIKPAHRMKENESSNVFDLSCYERPREGFESTDAVLLRKQISLKNADIQYRDGGGKESGWDGRWHLVTSSGSRGHKGNRRSWGRTTRRYTNEGAEGRR